MWFPPDAVAFDLNQPTPAPPALTPPGGVGILGTLIAALRMPGRTPAATARPRPRIGYRTAVTADHVHATTPQSRIGGRLLRAVGERDVPAVIEQTCAVACAHGPCAPLLHPVMLWLLTQLGLLLRERVGVDGESFAFEMLTGAEVRSEPTALSDDDACGLRIRVLAALSQDHTPPPWAPRTTGPAVVPIPPERVRMLLDALLWLDDLLDYNL
ncbi:MULTISPECIES: hypothetical protein [unclassified Rhodococcus (in: high G+C Gram-positive bacteria)]|uniref:hypothetical protein n=1 Tax=unclassified Rhodococcus (in: high G+C Gram-positive bacteria) TaxID=192944 RepID=UPI0002A2A5C0|nr:MULTISPECIES: hypothetical protein [unclassified Rhodococcus (in: high G+C Gram-positive bacteria)]ELB86454.1 hypothetical protein Rwratislav_44866 [Rhodococcus wratislaviensis IFP 2016]